MDQITDFAHFPLQLVTVKEIANGSYQFSESHVTFGRSSMTNDPC
jgi:hypothetical protein